MYALMKGASCYRTRSMNIKATKYLNLINVYLPVLLPQFLIGRLHSIHSGHRVAEIVCGEDGRFHVECLLLDLSELRLVHLLLLQCTQCSLFYSRLERNVRTWSI